MTKKELKEIFKIHQIAAYKDQIVYKQLTKKEFEEIFNRTLSYIRDYYRAFLERTYLGDNKFWWVDYYSKSAYYFNLKYAQCAFGTIFTALL